MRNVSRRARELGTENAFVVLGEVERLVGRGQGHRLVLHRPARLPHAGPHPPGRDPRDHRGQDRLHAVAGHPGAARGGRRLLHAHARDRGRARRTSSAAAAGSRSSATRSCRSPTTARGTRSIYPEPGLPDLPARRSRRSGAVPVPLRAARGARLRLRPRRAAKKINDKTRLLILCSPHNPTGGSAEPRRPRGRSPRSCAPLREPVDLLGRGLLGARLRRRVPQHRRGARDARAHDHRRLGVEDLRDDRLAHRLRGERRARAGLHALGHEHRLLPAAPEPVRGRSRR